MTYSPCAQTNWTIEWFLREMVKCEAARDACQDESSARFFYDNMATSYYLDAQKLMAKPSPLLGRPTTGCDR